MFKRTTQLLAALCLTLVANANAAIPLRPQIDVTGYVIHADLEPASGKLTATAVVTFTALDDLNVAVFGLNNGLQLTSVADGASNLTYERNVTDSTVRVTPAAIVSKGSSAIWTFTYSGKPTVETSPVDGIDFATVADPVSVLLYPGRWFPIALPGLFTDRFTAEIHVTVPKGETVIGSGAPAKASAASHDMGDGRTQYDFNWTKSGFPGTLVAGKFLPAITAPGIPNIRVFVTEPNKAKAKDFAITVTREFEFMTDKFGGAESSSPATERPPARQHRRAPVVRFAGLSRYAQRRLDHQRHVPLCRAALSRRHQRQDRLPVRDYRR
jgi:hypothetical protein